MKKSGMDDLFNSSTILECKTGIFFSKYFEDELYHGGRGYLTTAGDDSKSIQS